MLVIIEFDFEIFIWYTIMEQNSYSSGPIMEQKNIHEIKFICELKLLTYVISLSNNNNVIEIYIIIKHLDEKCYIVLLVLYIR